MSSPANNHLKEFDRCGNFVSPDRSGQRQSLKGTTMNHPNQSVFQRSESQRSEVESQSQRNQGAPSNSPRFVACLVLLPEDSKSLADLLQEFASASHLVWNIPDPTEPRPPIQPPYEDSWLTHEEAALYLGIAKPRSIGTRASRCLKNTLIPTRVPNLRIPHAPARTTKAVIRAWQSSPSWREERSYRRAVIST
jgi:hypothetical protein